MSELFNQILFYLFNICFLIKEIKGDGKINCMEDMKLKKNIGKL